MATKGKKTSGLQPISELFAQSWNVYKQTYLEYLKVVGIGILLVLVGAVIAVLFALPLYISAGGNVDRIFVNTTGLQFFSIFLLFFWVLLYLIILCIYSMAMPISYLFILTATKKVSIKHILVKTKPFIVPYLLVNLLVGFLIMGGLAVLIAPGVIISLLFSFVLNVVVLENKKGRAALVRSYQLVKAYFWGLLWRIIIVEVAVGVVSNVLNRAGKDSVVFSLVSQAFSIFAEWFVVIYLFLLYKRICSQIPANTKVKMTWIWVVSIIGWVIIIGIIGALLSGAITLPPANTVAV